MLNPYMVKQGTPSSAGRMSTRMILPQANQQICRILALMIMSYALTMMQFALVLTTAVWQMMNLLLHVIAVMNTTKKMQL